jgi:hypothetical protein
MAETISLHDNNFLTLVNPFLDKQKAENSGDQMEDSINKAVNKTGMLGSALFYLYKQSKDWDAIINQMK